MKRILAVILVLAMLGAACIGFAEEEFSACIGTSLIGSSAEQVSNIRRAAATINGTRISSGAEFSFNETVGPRSKAYGFLPAEDGRGISVTGGGTEQVATTLYLALQECAANVEYTSFRSYGSRFAGKYADAKDAVLVDYSSSIDFAFTNLGGDMDIRMWVESGSLYCGLTIAEPVSDGITWSARSLGRMPAAQASFRLRDDEALINNIRLAASSINDTALAPGEVFSFNDTVGPRIAENGFMNALNGRGVTVTGGGVAQVASVIWLAMQDCEGVAVAEKATYGSKYNQNYVESSNDAIMVDYKTGRDFSFRNTGDTELTICTYIQDGALYCEFYRD